MKEKNRKLIIIGAGGHGRVAADVAEAMNVYESIAFLDDGTPGILPKYPILGTVKEAASYVGEWDVVIAIGSSRTRECITEMLRGYGAKFATLIHPSAIIGSDVCIDEGTMVMPGVVINAGARIGKFVILNTCCSVDHDCYVANYCHVSVGAHLCGTVSLAEHVWVGAGAMLINNISVVGNCMIGAGAVLVKDIEAAGTYVGVPAKRIK